MQSTSFKRITLLGFSGPVVIILGAVGFVIFGRGQAAMLPSTVAALLFYGALITVGVAWHDGAPRLFESKPTYLVVLGVVTLALGATIWLDATLGLSGLIWRPVLSVAICLWFGVVLGSVVPRRAFISASHP